MIYFIMPVGSDPTYGTKRKLLDRILHEKKTLGHFPLEREAWDQFGVSEVLKDMGAADCIIADLSLERPSCYYEVGLAHGAGLEVQLIAPSGTPVHQVYHREDVRYYSDMTSYAHLVRSILP